MAGDSITVPSRALCSSRLECVNQGRWHRHETVKVVDTFSTQAQIACHAVGAPLISERYFWLVTAAPESTCSCFCAGVGAGRCLSEAMPLRGPSVTAAAVASGSLAEMSGYHVWLQMLCAYMQGRGRPLLRCECDLAVHHGGVGHYHRTGRICPSHCRDAGLPVSWWGLK